MDKLRIRGGQQLKGEIAISGAKNAALPQLCAALLTEQTVTLHNVPRLQDVATMLRLIRNMGVNAERGEDGSVTLNAMALNNPQAPYDLVKTMRASVLALGPLMARCGHAKVSLPGGCAIGSRPVDQHIKGLQAMGAEISVEHGYILAKTARLHGARITTDMVTVTGVDGNFGPAPGDGSSFAGWLAGNASSPESLQLYAFGAASPATPLNRSNLPASSVSNGSLVLTYFVRQEATNANLVTPQTTTNLVDTNSWGTGSITHATLETNTVDGVRVVKKTASVPIDTVQQKFLRLKISE